MRKLWRRLQGTHKEFLALSDDIASGTRQSVGFLIDLFDYFDAFASALSSINPSFVVKWFASCCLVRNGILAARRRASAKHLYLAVLALTATD